MHTQSTSVRVRVRVFPCARVHVCSCARVRVYVCVLSCQYSILMVLMMYDSDSIINNP